MANFRETGLDATVTVGGSDVAYTTASYDIVHETASSDLNDRPGPYTAEYSRYLEGSIEWDGTQVDPVSSFMNGDGSQNQDITIVMEDGEKSVTATEITLTNMNRELPADGKTNTTIDFKADQYDIDGL